MGRKPVGPGLYNGCTGLYNCCSVMTFLSSGQRTFLDAVSQLAYCNPFLPEWVEWERAALGREFVAGEAVWSQPVDAPEQSRVNVGRVAARLGPLLDELARKLRAGARAGERDLGIYEDGALQWLYTRYYPRFFAATFGSEAGRAGRWRFYREFRADWGRLLEIDGVTLPGRHEPVHAFACFRQIQCAFEQIFRDIIGSSLAAARLRAAVWQSVFTHDMRRYRRTLYRRMSDFATLITGPSGTGKELAARAIAQSRYVPFDEARLAFADDGALFFPINIAALSPTLVESELFGHRRGAFTGAVGDRKGWLETCPALGSVFLDELGDLDPGIQVKLLRVIETRRFHPVGDTASLQFAGKLIAATNRDLAADMREGRFREDLYYRLCSDQIATPPLSAQLADSPRVLRELVVYMTRRVAGEEGESLAGEVMEWIEANLGPRYEWPGNYRELEQCVKNVLIRRDYRPARAGSGDEMEAVRAGRLTAAELLGWYCKRVYGETGSYEETARRLGIDRRTVKAKVTGG
jgi:transcriptional regulator with AAA-type ATPase domain